MTKFLLFLISLLSLSLINVYPGEINKGLVRIQSDYKSGKIDFEYQLLQKFYYSFNKSKLAPIYFDSDSKPTKCGTELVLEYYNHKSELSESAVKEISQFLSSPFKKTSTSSVYVSPSGKFQITYDITGNNAVPTTDNNGNGIPDYVEWVGSYFDYVWHFEIDSLGYLAPPIGTGRYQVGFENMDSYGYTVPIDSQLTQIVLHNNFLNFPPNTDPDGNQKGAAKVTAAHEFKHATQIMYNNWMEPIWFLEMDATWMEDIAFNQVNDYYNYLSSSQIVNPNRSFDRGEGYEDCIWLHYLSQKFGVPINRQIWERRKAASSENIYDTFDNILMLNSFSFIKGYKEYFTWNYGCGTNLSPIIRSYKEAAKYPNPTICNTQSIPDSTAGCGNTELSANYFYYSSITSDNFVKLSNYLSPNADQSLELIILYKNNTEEIRDTNTAAGSQLNYILPQKLSDIKAIIAIPIVTTTETGNYFNSLKASLFGTAKFIITPLKDIETSIPRIIKVNVISENDIVIKDSIKLFYRSDNSLYTFIKMTATGSPNEYSATLPAFALGTNVYYYISIYDILGNYTFLPGTAPSEPYKYFEGVDTKPPVITNIPITQKTKYDFPFSLFAGINDNIGIDSVFLEYNFNGGSYYKKAFTNYRDSIYYVTIDPDSSTINAMTDLTYRITAVDNSSRLNRMTFPETGYQQVKVFPGFRYISEKTKAITDNDPAGINDTIKITNDFIINDIKIFIHASHSRFSDLSANITPPFSNTSELFQNPGLGTQFENARDPNIILEQDAYLSMRNFESIDSGAVTGEYRPDTVNLNNFANNHSKGNWILNLSDNRQGAAGTLIDWGLIFNAVGETNGELPDQFYLAQNFPNPFNPSTRIRYSILYGSNVEIKVFDILGRERDVLVNEYKPAGNYEIEFTTRGKGFSSGIYFYKLTAGNFTSVKKMIILK
jgi:subtilisin-like proprotein convertase family protein